MRIKTFIIFLLSGVIIFFCLIYLGGHQRPSFQTLVSETHKRFNNLKNFKENLRYAEEKRLQAEEKHLTLLGFTDNPRVYPTDCWTNTTLPVIVTILFNGQEKMVYSQGVGFAKNTAHMAGNHAVLIYNIGLSASGLLSVATHCNTSQCQIVPFDITLFPTHVQDDPDRTVRALVIQDALNKAGAILYVDSKFRLTSYIDSLIEKKPVGSFVTKQAVTTLTHPNMMDYFKANVESFLFLPMIEISRLLIWNTLEVHEQVMLPWVQCVLTPECVHPIVRLGCDFIGVNTSTIVIIFPGKHYRLPLASYSVHVTNLGLFCLGAQSEGCRFNKKPQYRYSGCHAYDSSALNVVLGLTYKFNKTIYTFPMQDTFFVLSESVDNSTAV